MARNLAAAGIGTCVLVASSLLVAPPAQAQWTDVGSGTDFSICKRTTMNGKGWRFRTRVSKPDAVADARGGVSLWRRHHRHGHWRSGWLGDAEVRHGRPRIRKTEHVRVIVWEESGDRASPIGTALQLGVYRPRNITHC